MNRPAGCESFFMDYLGTIHIAGIRIDLTDWSIELCNSFSRTLFKEMDQPALIEFFRSFVNIADPDSVRSFSGSQKRILHGNYVLSGFYFQEPESVAWVFLQDVTEKIRLESIAEAVNVMDNIGYIFSGIRHEIGNPINTIKMTMSVLKKNLTRLPMEKIQSYIDRTLDEIIRLEELLQSLKSYNMFDKPKPQNVHLQTFMNKFISLIEQDFQMEGVSIKINTSGDIWAWADPRGLQQVMLNIMTNAFDALRDVSNPRIVINLYRIIDQAFIKIIDNGCGISDEDKNNLFQPFYTTKIKGTGLGLVISRKILKGMASSIRIQSELGRGSSVILSLPRGTPDE